MCVHHKSSCLNCTRYIVFLSNHPRNELHYNHLCRQLWERCPRHHLPKRYNPTAPCLFFVARREAAFERAERAEPVPHPSHACSHPQRNLTNPALGWGPLLRVRVQLPIRHVLPIRRAAADFACACGWSSAAPLRTRLRRVRKKVNRGLLDCTFWAVGGIGGCDIICCAGE